MFTRRRFMKTGVAAAGIASLARAPGLWPFTQSPAGLAKFVQPLPRFGTDIPYAKPTGTGGGADLYESDIVQTTHSFHPALPPSRISLKTAFAVHTGALRLKAIRMAVTFLKSMSSFVKSKL